MEQTKATILKQFETLWVFVIFSSSSSTKCFTSCLGTFFMHFRLSCSPSFWIMSIDASQSESDQPPFLLSHQSFSLSDHKVFFFLLKTLRRGFISFLYPLFPWQINRGNLLHFNTRKLKREKSRIVKTLPWLCEIQKGVKKSSKTRDSRSRNASFFLSLTALEVSDPFYCPGWCHSIWRAFTLLRQRRPDLAQSRIKSVSSRNA